MEEITYNINEVSERMSVSYRTLHYWQQKLALQINRDGAGNRIYTENDVELLEKVKELKLKGMTLDGIKELLREKGILQQPENTNLIIIDEKSLELKEYLINDIREVVSQELNQGLLDINTKLEQILCDNQDLRQSNDDLREELRKLQHQNNDHYSKIDLQLSAWRNKKPWYKTIFKKKD